jgi:2'-hydroxyisoflavone reductase
VDDAFLEARELDAGQLPFWFPPAFKNLFAVSVEKAINAGLKFRPAVQTAKDTLEWREAGSVADLKVGLKPEKEAELLKEWHEQKA